MTKTGLWSTVSACVYLLGMMNSADAALVSRLNGQAVYDSDLNITWLADANLAASNTFGITQSANVFPNFGEIGSTGRMNWYTANTWIEGMNSANYLGFNDWRLPTTLVPDTACSNTDSTGFNCIGSEMGHLFYTEFGATASTSVLTTGNPTELAKFSNVQSSSYWSGTEFFPFPSNVLVFFFGDFPFGGGLQFADGKDSSSFVWAVRSGDVSAVPIPAAVWLFGSGLIGLLGVAKRRR